MKLGTLFILFIGSFIFSNHLIAQTVSKISGQVIDGNKKPINAATINLLNAKDSTPVKTVVANEEGKFELTAVSDGNYFVKVVALGFKEYTSTIIQVSQKDVQLNTIELQISKTNELKEVVVSSTIKPFVEQKIDRTIVNVDAQISNTGTNTLEVLQKTPGVMVDENGNISLKGKTGVLVLIDDKPTYMSAADLAAYLKSLPSSVIDKIELMENPPAKYDAAGNAGVINIRTKKQKTKGLNTNFSLSYNQGVYWRYNGSLNVNYRSNKINLYANIGTYHAKTLRILDVNRNYFDANHNPTSSFQQSNHFTPISHNGNFKVGLDYNSSAKTTWGIVFTGGLSNVKESRPSNSYLYNATNQLDSTVVADNLSLNKFKRVSANINYLHKFDSTGKTISFDVDYAKYHSSNNLSFLNSVYFPDGSLIDAQKTICNAPSLIDIYSAKTDFALPINSKTKFEAGLKSSYVTTDNAAYYFNVVGNSNVEDNINTNRFLYQENINAGYINFNKTFSRLSVQLGLRVENTNGFGHQLGNAAGGDSSFEKHYTDLFPTAYLSYKLDKNNNHTLNVSFGRRIGRPYYQDLNPFVFYLNKYSCFAGNPYLLPQFNNTYKLSYQFKSILTTAITYDYASDIQIETIEQKGNVFASTTGNIGERYYLGLSINLSVKPAKWWTMNFYTELNHNNYKGQLYTGYIDEAANWFYCNGNNQFNLSKGWSGEMSFFYVSSRAASQFVQVPSGQMGIALQKKVLQDKGVVKFSVRDIFHTQTSGGNITNVPNATVTYNNIFDSRVATLSFTLNLGKQFDEKPKKESSADSESNRVRN